MEVKNFSRHGFSTDQRTVLVEMFPGTELGAPQAPFFKGSEDFGAKVSGTTSSVVVLMEILLDALSEGLLEDGTVLLTWRADEAAKKRARFAARGIAAYRLGGGRWEKILSRSIEPTVEVGFQDGKEVPYGTPADSLK